MSRREQYQIQYGAYAGPTPLKKEYFPFFKDGDVKIVITGARQYQLHSSILKANSALMRRLLDDQYTAKLSKQAIKKGVVVRNKIHAVKDEKEDFIPLDVRLILEPINLDSEGRAIDAEPVGLDLENGIVVPPIYIAYDLVLGAFYHRPLDFGRFGEESLTDILEMALYVTEVAEYLEAVDIITKPIEAELLSTGQTLHRSIARDPAAWLDFAYRIKSKPVFREALIHAVGQYNTAAMQTAIAKSMKKDIVNLIVKKAKTLKDGVKAGLRNVLLYYPPHLQRTRTLGLADADNFGRNSYSNDIFSWMALTVFRHYVAQYVANDLTHHAPDMGYSLAFSIGGGSDRYLDKICLNEFYKLFPMSSKAMAVVENKINDIKKEVKQFLEPFVINNAELNTVQYSYKYFTCTKVEYFDYPWISRPAEVVEDSSESDDDELTEADSKEDAALRHDLNNELGPGIVGFD